MFSALRLSFAGLTDSYFWKILALSLLICASLFTLSATNIYLGITSLGLAETWWFGWLFEWLGVGAAFVLGYFLLPLTFPLVTLLFAGKIIHHLEHVHYPGRCAGFSPPFHQELLSSLRFVLVALLINVVAFPFYWIPGIYYIVNGYLLGREYFEMIGLRYMTAQETNRLCKTMFWRIWLAGMIIALLFTVPFLNLLAPILAIIFIAHVWHESSEAPH